MLELVWFTLTHRGPSIYLLTWKATNILQYLSRYCVYMYIHICYIYVRLNALIIGIICPIWKILFAIEGSILEEGFRQYNITLRNIGADQKGRQAENRKIHAILYNWKTANRIEEGFSLNNTAKRAENATGWYHACSYRFRDISLQFTPFMLIVKNCFPRVSPIFSRYTHDAF